MLQNFFKKSALIVFQTKDGFRTGVFRIEFWESWAKVLNDEILPAQDNGNVIAFYKL